jgi:hypothetical protein
MRRFSIHCKYKGIHLRSLKELAFAYQLDQDKRKWESGEQDKYAVTYTDVYGKVRKYYPDFFVDNFLIIEIKPTCYQKSKTVKLKAEAMRKFCDLNRYQYNIVSPRKIDKKILVDLIEKGLVTFDPYYQKFIDNYLNKKK